MSHFTAGDINHLFIKAYEAAMQNNFDQAIEYSQNIYNASTQYYGPIHTNTIEALNSLVVYCKEAKRIPEALHYASLAYEKTKEVYGIHHEKTEKIGEVIEILKNEC